MSLRGLTIRNLRCIEGAELEIPAGLTLIWGDNGSGKTSILEAIFLLGRGRSFHTRNTEPLIRYGQTQITVSGVVSRPLDTITRLSVEVARGTTTARIDGREVDSLAELSQTFAVQVIEPGIHRLVEESGYRRRRWLDWAVFHVEPRFIEAWVRYVRTLRQRNAALKGEGGDAWAWDPELSRLGEAIDVARRRTLEQLQPYWRETVGVLAGLDVELHYLRGWKESLALAEALDASRGRDQARQLTHPGPHRADIALRLRGRVAREVLSRGQQKLVAAAMTLAQIRLLQEMLQVTPTLLLDDPAAELDGDRLQRFIGEVARLRCQLIVTSLHAESRLFGAPERMFRVEAGSVQPL